MSDDIQRKRIIDELNNNLLVEASAGSGKTSMLVDRLVSLVENEGVDISKVVALTFTKKAAGEFYKRFYDKLQLRTKPGFDYKIHDRNSKLLNPGDSGKVSKDVAIERDKNALKNIDTCFFGTIDAFYQKILNEHPFEAKLSSSATIISDEEFENYLIRKFAEYLKSDNKDIRELAEFFNKVHKTSEFVSLMIPLIQNIDLDIYQIPIKLDSAIKAFSDDLNIYKEGVKAIYDNQNYFKKLSKDGTLGKKQAEKWDYLNGHINQLLNLSDDDYKNGKSIASKLNELSINEDKNNYLSPSFKAVYVNVGGAKGNLYTLNDVKKKQAENIIFFKTIEFLKLVRKDVYDSLVKNGKLTFSIATDYLYNLLKDEDNYKTTITEIRNKISHILLDECQDTDEKQYEIFYRLVASDFNKEYLNLNIDGGKLYICGDRKQGIYHFRGADVSVYDTIKNNFEERNKLGVCFDIVNLTDNFRSKGEMKDYFNDKFKDWPSLKYSPISNTSAPDPKAGYGVYKYIYDKKEDDPEIVKNIILDLVSKKTYKFKDFMVITSSKDSISQYSKAFSESNIPCYCEGHIDIHVTKLLDTVISLFKYVGSYKNDKISYFEVLASGLFDFDFSKTVDTSVDYLDLLKINFKTEEFPSSLLEKIVSNESVIRKLNCKGIDVLIGFISLLREKENSGEIQNYKDAIEYFKDLQNDDLLVERLSLLSNNINAVQIANVHKTKGLEKKVVILTAAGANKQKPSSGKEKGTFYFYEPSGAYFDAIIKNNFANTIPQYDIEDAYNEEEAQRLLYVAATRAGDRLYIAIPSSKTSKWHPLLPANPIVPTINPTINDSVKTIAYNEGTETHEANKTKDYVLRTPSREKAIKKFDEEYEVTSSSNEDALIIGSAIHKLLEDIIKAKNYLLPDTICEAIASSYNRPDIDKVLIDVKTKFYNGGFAQTEHVFENDDLFEFSKKCECLTEVPFSYKDHNDVVSGFIDLVLVSNDKVIIVDYKTDLKEEDHSKQLSYYKKAIESSKEYKDKTIIACIYHVDK